MRPVEAVAPVLVDVNEAATLLSVSRSTIYKLIKTGELPVKKIGRAARLRRADVLALAG
ncbi:MAG TPA: helix-turn-helix domain-containing protein [Hyphomicrobium zavarzinii]|nr:helix-turn-helix domain-containing protein [Hyphomicrobium zavarzinii]